MARVSGDKQTYNFTRGLITEASPLTYPENSATTLSNFDLELSGRVRRRLGIDFESSGGSFATITEAEMDAGSAISVFEWRSVGGLGDRNFLVVQIGYNLYVFDLSISPLSSSSGDDGQIAFDSSTVPIDLSSFKVGSTYTKEEMSFSSGKGFLFVTSADIEPVSIKYTPESSAKFVTAQVNIEIRDFDGIEEGIEDNFRPTTLSSDHIYNLRNQGWPKEAACAGRSDGKKGTFFVDPVQWTKTATYDGGLNRYPSNADIFHLGKLSSATDPNNVGSFHPFNLKKYNLTTKAPRGHFIINAFTRDRTSVAITNDTVPDVIRTRTNEGDAFIAAWVAMQMPPGVSNNYTGLTKQTAIPTRPSTTAFFAGRVFYAGAPDEEVGSTIFYSQLLTDVDKAGRCYQENDPTAEVLNNLLDTDGGTVEIPDIGRISKMVPFQDVLIVFASNGVWAIRGGADTGFTPTTFSVDFLTQVGPVSQSSITETDIGIIYWADSGIYALTRSEDALSLVANNITEKTIETLYLAIDSVGKKTAKGFYDRDTKKLLWVYNSAPASVGTDTPYKFDKALFLNLKLEAFYEQSISALVATDTIESPFVAGIVRKGSTTITPVSEDVEINGVSVEINGEQVVINENLLEANTSAAIKLLTLQGSGTNFLFYFSEFKDTNFVDWATTNTANATLSGGGYTSELESGYELLGAAAKEKQVKWAIFHFDRTEQNFIANGDDVDYDFPSSALVRVKFDWTDSTTAGRWGRQYEAYKLKRDYWPDGAEAFDYSFTVISFKQRVRGRGRAIQYQVQSSPGKDLRMLGWDAVYTGRART